VVGVFSLEMSNEQLVNRLLCSQARVDAHRLRSGYLSKDEWRRLAISVGELAETKIYLDDTPGISVLEMRAKARRLKNEQKALDLLIVDYLQLMSGRGRNESRQQEVSQISRELKMLAKELNVPMVALSQLSRAPETRTGSHKPQLSDLRESGCLAGESLVTMADSGAQIPIRDLVGKSGFKVWALNEANFRLEPAVVSRAFSTGVKPVFRLTTRLGRTIRATANHKFRAFAGWKRLDELTVGEHLALPRVIENPARQTMSNDELALLGHLIGDGCTLPRHVIQYTTREKDLAETVADLAMKVFGNEVNPRINQERKWYQVYLTSTRRHTHNVHSAISDWLRDLGVWGLRSYEKRIPEKVFEQPAAAIGLFLRHLWATDGCIRLKPGFYAPAVYYASSSEELARGVQSLLLRLGINAWLRRRPQNGKGRDQYHISLTGKPDLEQFAKRVGAVGDYKRQSLKEVMGYLEDRQPNTNRDVIPNAVWREVVVPAMQDAGLTTRQMMAGINIAYCGSTLYKHNLSRDRAARVAQIVGSNSLALLAQSEVYWDQIVSIEFDGETDVYDLTVPGLQSFESKGFMAHNSIEQDADVVMFIYREEVYKPETEKQNIAEIIIGKQRNGPIGSVELVFLKQLTRFEDKFNEQA
jgi:replicative DNA helicase